MSSLTENDIGISGAKELSKSLMTNTTLTYLDLCGDDKKRMKEMRIR